MARLDITPEELFQLLGEQHAIRFKLEQSAKAHIERLQTEYEELRVQYERLREDYGKLVQSNNHDPV